MHKIEGPVHDEFSLANQLVVEDLLLPPSRLAHPEDASSRPAYYSY